MRCTRRVSASLIAVVLAVPTGACGGGDDKKAASSPAPSNTPSSPAPTATSDAAAQLPPAFVQCMAERGFDVTSSADIHSAPPDVLQTCFSALHAGGG
jgi:hypothetical protein